MDFILRPLFDDSSGGSDDGVVVIAAGGHPSHMALLFLLRVAVGGSDYNGRHGGHGVASGCSGDGCGGAVAAANPNRYEATPGTSTLVDSLVDLQSHPDLYSGKEAER